MHKIKGNVVLTVVVLTLLVASLIVSLYTKLTTNSNVATSYTQQNFSFIQAQNILAQCAKDIQQQVSYNNLILKVIENPLTNRSRLAEKISYYGHNKANLYPNGQCFIEQLSLDESDLEITHKYNLITLGYKANSAINKATWMQARVSLLSSVNPIDNLKLMQISDWTSLVY